MKTLYLPLIFAAALLTPTLCVSAQMATNGPPKPTPGNPAKNKALQEYNRAIGECGVLYTAHNPSSGAPTGRPDDAVKYKECEDKAHAALDAALKNAQANPNRPSSSQPPPTEGTHAMPQSNSGSYVCFVSTKDTGMEQTLVQAESDTAAKAAALKKFGSRAFGLVGVSCNKN